MPEPAIAPRDISAEEARALLAKSAPGALTLLDVRQNWEYEEFHLPGATLLPLAELEDRMTEVPTDKPLLVYCHSGRRSAAASSILAAQGHADIMNMQGGIMAWKGATAVGAPDSGRVLFERTATPADVLVLAFAMEKGLGAFYQELAQSVADADVAATFRKLAGFEDKHKLVVFHLYKRHNADVSSVEDLERKADLAYPSGVMEGGREGAEVTAGAKPLETVHNALDMAMGIEAQALDLYMRQAALATDVETMNALHELAKEERGHLRALALMLDRLGGVAA